jgi:predicted esterase
MVVLDQPALAGSLTGKSVLIASGNLDPIVPDDHPPRLAGLLRAGGATVTLHTAPAGHGLAAADIAAAQNFLAAR